MLYDPSTGRVLTRRKQFGFLRSRVEYVLADATEADAQLCDAYGVAHDFSEPGIGYEHEPDEDDDEDDEDDEPQEITIE
jgi:hypothetical protein